MNLHFIDILPLAKKYLPKGESLTYENILNYFGMDCPSGVISTKPFSSSLIMRPNKLECFPLQSYKPSLIFPSKIWVYPSVVPRSIRLLAFSANIRSVLKDFARNKCSSLFCLIIGDNEKSFITFTKGCSDALDYAQRLKQLVDTIRGQNSMEKNVEDRVRSQN